MTTVSSMVTQSTNKMLFDRLATAAYKNLEFYLKQKKLLNEQVLSNPVVVSGARGLGEMKTLLQSIKKPLYGAG